MEKKLYYLIFVYLIIVILQTIYTYNNDVFLSDIEFNKKIEYNKKNINRLFSEFNSILKERTDLLESGKMDYYEWIEYNKKNTIVYIDNKPYYIFIFDDVNICRVHADKNYIDLDWDDIVKSTEENLRFTKYTTSKDLIENMYRSGNLYESIPIKYYWVDPLTNRNVGKISTVLNWKYDKLDKDGIIGMGIDIENVDEYSRFRYIDVINKPLLFTVCLLTLFISSIILILNEKSDIQYSKSYTFLFITNIYILYYINSWEYTGSSISEDTKTSSINSGLLSLLFLMSVNIFILNSLSQKTITTLFVESAIVLCISLMLLLFSLMKSSNHITVLDTIQDRITKQFTFNISIFLNTLIILNYLIHILRTSKFFKNIK